MSDSARRGGKVLTPAGQHHAAVAGQWQPASAGAGSAPARLIVLIGPGSYRGTDLT